MKKTTTMCLIFLIALSIYAASRPQKDIKISPEQKFKLWLNDTIKHINGKYSISSDSTLLTVTDSFSYIVKKGKTTYTTNRNNSEAIQKMLRNAHEPSCLSYRVIAVRRDEFTPSKITHTENQRVINFMVQVRDTISILNNRNQ